MKRSEIKWKKPFDVYHLVSHEDQRGRLFEILRFEDQEIPGQGQLYTFSIEPRQRRGDHYHEEKSEWFTCVYGESVLLLSAEQGPEAAIRLSAQDPKIVYAGPHVTHAVLNDTETVAVFVSYGSQQHDPDRPDTFKRIAYPEYETLIREPGR